MVLDDAPETRVIDDSFQGGGLAREHLTAGGREAVEPSTVVRLTLGWIDFLYQSDLGHPSQRPVEGPWSQLHRATRALLLRIVSVSVVAYGMDA